MDVGEIVSLVFTGWKRTLKSIIDLEVYFDNDSTNTYFRHGGKVTLYARKRQSSSWTMVREFQTDSSSNPDWFVILWRNEFWEMWNFNQIEFKMRLEPISDGVSWKTSPLITYVTLNYEDNIKWS